MVGCWCCVLIDPGIGCDVVDVHTCRGYLGGRIEPTPDDELVSSNSAGSIHLGLRTRTTRTPSQGGDVEDEYLIACGTVLRQSMSSEYD